MSTERLIASHLRLAAEPLNAAKLLATQQNPYAAYLAEQAAEQLVVGPAQSDRLHGALDETGSLIRRAAEHVDVDLDPASRKPASDPRGDDDDILLPRLHPP